MNEFRAKIGENGRIVIPVTCRRLLNLKTGEELVIRVENNEMRLATIKQTVKKAKTLVKCYAKNRSLVNKLIKMRQEDNNE